MTDLTNATNITPPRVDFLDPRTGKVSREWYMFFLSLFRLTGSGTNNTTLEDLQLGPADTGTTFLDVVSALETWALTLPPMAECKADANWLSPAAYIPPIADDLAPVPQPVTGATGTFTTVDLKTVTVLNGLIVSIV
jgi:hypothetical protein